MRAIVVVVSGNDDDGDSHSMIQIILSYRFQLESRITIVTPSNQIAISGGHF